MRTFEIEHEFRGCAKLRVEAIDADQAKERFRELWRPDDWADEWLAGDLPRVLDAAVTFHAEGTRLHPLEDDQDGTRDDVGDLDDDAGWDPDPELGGEG